MKSSAHLPGTAGDRAPMKTRENLEDSAIAQLGNRRSGVTPQERQRPQVELGDVLVEGRMRAPVEDEQFGVPDAALESIRESGGRELIVASDRDLRRRANAAERRLHVVSKNGIRLLDERRH